MKSDKPAQVHVKGAAFGRITAKAVLTGLLLMVLGMVPAYAAAKATFTPSGGKYTGMCVPGPLPMPLGCNVVGVCCPTTPEELLVEFSKLNSWYTNTFWKMIEEKLGNVTNTIKAGIDAQTVKQGGFIQAQENVKAISSLQQGSASVARDNLPSESLCRYATLSEELTSSEANANAVQQKLAKTAIDRQLLIENTDSALNTSGENGKPGLEPGQAADKNARWEEYKTTFCDPSDFGMQDVCKTANDQQYNRDINFAATIAEPLTLDIGADNSPASLDQTNLTALNKNLYGHDLVNNIPPATFDASSDENATQVKKYMQFLSAISKRSVAENSFAAITAMKAKGSGGNALYLQNLMIELGVPKEEAEKFITNNPSYYAQMEALTRRMYQSPSYYVNLMEGPVNVKRQQAAMKSFELMQQRDMYQSLKRSEMLMATLLELELANNQGDLNKKMGQSK